MHAVRNKREKKSLESDIKWFSSMLLQVNQQEFGTSQEQYYSHWHE